MSSFISAGVNSAFFSEHPIMDNDIKIPIIKFFIIASDYNDTLSFSKYMN